jgi:hypothetical protein
VFVRLYVTTQLCCWSTFYFQSGGNDWSAFNMSIKHFLGTICLIETGLTSFSPILCLMASSNSKLFVTLWIIDLYLVGLLTQGDMRGQDYPVTRPWPQQGTTTQRKRGYSYMSRFGFELTIPVFERSGHKPQTARSLSNLRVKSPN